MVQEAKGVLRLMGGLSMPQITRRSTLAETVHTVSEFLAPVAQRAAAVAVGVWLELLATVLTVVTAVRSLSIIIATALLSPRA